MTQNTTDYDVAVIGLGPVGATIANLLALRGLSVAVLERDTEIYPLPRAIQFDGETMRVFQTIGIAEELLPDLVVAARMVFIDDEGHTLIDWIRPTDVMPQGWNTSYRFHQPSLERALRDKLEAQPNVDVLLGAEVSSISEDADGVSLEYRLHGNDAASNLRAGFVVGSDGARSMTRKHLGTKLDDLKSHERWLVVDCLLKQDKPELGDDSIQYCDPDRPATYVRGPHDRRRWELMLHADEDADLMMQESKVWELLSPWITPEEATIERPAVYTFHSVVADGWASQRVFLAGDACHQTPPFMGQGMCAGVRDASNLAWKIAEVVEGRADRSLLETYETERSPHVRTFIQTAVRLGSVISTTDHDVAKERNRRMRSNPESFATPQPRLGMGWWDAEDQTAGFIGEQPFLDDGRRADDVAGYEWMVLVRPSSREAAAELFTGLEHRPEIVEVPDSHDSWLQHSGSEAVLLRPDRYVAARADSSEGFANLRTQYERYRAS